MMETARNRVAVDQEGELARRDFLEILMLISFSVQNYRSFDSEQTLSLVACQRTQEHPEHVRPIPGSNELLLPTAIVYGANGAGKSNLVRALNHFRTLVLTGTKPGQEIGVTPFLLRSDAAEEPIRMELRILIESQVIVYGFSATRQIIKEEWLYEQVGSAARMFFDRRPDGQNGTSLEIDPLVADERSDAASKLSALAQVGTRREQLFLTAIYENINRSAQGPIISGLLDWLQNRLRVMTPDARHDEFITRLADSDAYAQFAGDFLREAGTGVDGIAIHSASETLSDKMPLEAQVLDLTYKAANGAVPPNRRVLVGDDDEYALNPDTNSVVYRRIMAEHITAEQGKASLPLREESDGTRRLMHLLPALHQAANGQGVFVLDEIDRSLHPLLAWKFIQGFLHCARRWPSQLIATTHDTNLLDLGLFRRDEIWFAEKTPAGATTLYPLSDFKVRDDLRVDKGYLQGRFGAIPFLGGIDRLFPRCKDADGEDTISDDVALAGQSIRQ